MRKKYKEPSVIIVDLGEESLLTDLATNSVVSDQAALSGSRGGDADGNPIWDD